MEQLSEEKQLKIMSFWLIVVILFIIAFIIEYMKTGKFI